MPWTFMYQQHWHDCSPAPSKYRANSKNRAAAKQAKRARKQNR